MAVSIHTKRVTKPFMASVADIRTYVYGATYDSWNRVQTMTYPDGEVVTYHYNAAGQVESMTSNKQGRQSVIVDRIGYDKEGHTVYTKLGNGAALAGYGLTLTGAGAAAGVPLAGIGEVVSLVGSLSEILLDFANGDYGNSIKGLIYKGGEELVGMGLNKVLPGYGKKIGEEGFDLGTEVIRQGVNLKLSGVERLTDKLIEEKENIRSNQNKD